MTELSLTVYFAFYAYLIMLLIQWLVATVSKAKRAGAIPGKLEPELSHESFTFRAHRTFMNTLENSPLFIGTLLLAFTLNLTSGVFALCVWLYVVARAVHMMLYYSIATEKNPSPRSYFFLIGLVSNITMLVLVGIRLLY
ncbi:MAPEG family protein [Pseudoalteromonas sp. N1230-9]|uniref:MAPEG family protein n=1 Tax=Pseudoalteromonas sp. N1230-9 TaxID=2907156 RepID=UPI002B27DA5B|nr:MAPEG family protein [Pseudoalteromonas sp. N1230-9]